MCAHLMSCNQVFGERAVIGEDVNDLSICQLMAGHDVLAVHLGSNHVVAHICVHMVSKVHHCRTLQKHTTFVGWYASTLSRALYVSMGLAQRRAFWFLETAGYWVCICTT